jgi:hypothetical protein
LTACGSRAPASVPDAALGQAVPHVVDTASPVQAQPTLAVLPTPPVKVTPSPRATVTPRPTRTPKPTSTSQALVAASQAVPTPGPALDFTGQGRSVVGPISLPSTMNVVRVKHFGRISRFIVTAFGPYGQDETLVDIVGSYNGMRPLLGGSGAWYLQIKSGGAWTVHIEAAPADEHGAEAYRGGGSAVSAMFMPPTVGPVTYTLLHNAGGQFIVHVYCAGGQETVENSVGWVQGDTIVNFKRGPCLWDVTADNGWSIERKH